MKTWTYSLIGLAFVASAAQAQQAGGSAAADPATSEATAPADHAAHASAETTASTSDAAALPYSAAEIDSFAKASVQINAINADAALDAAQKQTKMAAAAKEAGLDPAKYNEIGKAAAENPALMAQVQTAMARHASPSDG
jgi:hypothetical protein